MITLIKNMLLTAVIVVALQTQWQGKSLETRTVSWLAQSSIGHELRLVVHGAIEFINLAAEGGSQAIAKATKKVVTEAPGQRGFNIDRSESYFKEKASNLFSSSESEQDQE